MSVKREILKCISYLFSINSLAGTLHVIISDVEENEYNSLHIGIKICLYWLTNNFTDASETINQHLHSCTYVIKALTRDGYQKIQNIFNVLLVIIT